MGPGCCCVAVVTSPVLLRQDEKKKNEKKIQTNGKPGVDDRLEMASAVSSVTPACLDVSVKIKN